MSWCVALVLGNARYTSHTRAPATHAPSTLYPAVTLLPPPQPYNVGAGRGAAVNFRDRGAKEKGVGRDGVGREDKEGKWVRGKEGD